MLVLHVGRRMPKHSWVFYIYPLCLEVEPWVFRWTFYFSPPPPPPPTQCTLVWNNKLFRGDSMFTYHHHEDQEVYRYHSSMIKDT